MSEPKITVDISRREGESILDHLARIADMRTLPGTGTVRNPEIVIATGPLRPEPDWVRQWREAALAKLRPPPKKRKEKP